MMGEVRYAVRMLQRSPLFAVTAILILALGIGATTAIFTIVEAVVLRPLKIADPDNVFTVHDGVGERQRRSLSFQSLLQLQERSGGAFASVSGSGARSVSLSIGGDTRVSPAAFVTSNYLDLLGVRPQLGLFFKVGKPADPGEEVAVITDALWRSRLAGDPGVIGRQLQVAGRLVTIIGVAPRGFRGLRLSAPVDLFLPLESAVAFLPPANYFSDTRILINGRGFSPTAWLDVTVRLRPGVTREQAEAQLVAVRPGSQLIETAQVALAQGAGPDARRFAQLLLLSVISVLMLGCANIAGLVISRSEHRREEIAVRVALGASRWQVIRLLMTEQVILSSAAGVLGIGLASWMLQAMTAFVVPGGVRLDSLQLAVTGRALWVAAGLALLTAVTSGFFPGWAASRTDVVSVLRAPASRGSIRWVSPGTLLVAGQVAISFVLVLCAVLFARSLQAALATDVGPASGRIAYATISFRSDQQTEVSVARFYEEMTSRLIQLPGVEEASYGGLPLVLNSGSNQVFTVDGVARTLPDAILFHCGPDYFKTLGVAIAQGRDFNASDVAGGQRVAIVNEAFARAVWDGGVPIGKRITFLPHEQDFEVVGVARDGRYASLAEEGRLAFYLPWQQDKAAALGSGVIVVRTSAEATGVVPELRQAVSSVGPDVAVVRLGTLAGRIGELAMVQRLGTTLLGGVGVLALCLSSLGIFGLVSYSVAQRRAENGVRLALGAEPTQLVLAMMRRSMWPSLIGMTLGLMGAVAAARAAERFLFGIAPGDLTAYAAAGAILMASATAASYLPARRVAGTDPLRALKEP
jgi:predicted permease